MYHTGICRVSSKRLVHEEKRLRPAMADTERERERASRFAAMGVPVSSDGDSIKKETPLKSLDSLAAEAAMASADGDGYTEEQLSREERARKALECDCVAELREGPCGSQFSEAFYCFLTSTADEQGSDCIKSFIAMQTCMTANPEAFVNHSGNPDGNHSATANGESKPQSGEEEHGPPLVAPPAGVVKNPVS